MEEKEKREANEKQSEAAETGTFAETEDQQDCWTEEEEATIASIQESLGCSRTEAIRKMRASQATTKASLARKAKCAKLVWHPNAKDQDALIKFETAAAKFDASLSGAMEVILPLAIEVRRIFEAKPRGLAYDGCTTQGQYFSKHFPKSYSTIRSWLAKAGKTDQRFNPNKPIYLLGDGIVFDVLPQDVIDVTPAETDKAPKKPKTPEAEVIATLRTELKAAKAAIEEKEGAVSDLTHDLKAKEKEVKRLEAFESKVEAAEAKTKAQVEAMTAEANKRVDAEKAVKAAQKKISLLETQLEGHDREAEKLRGIIEKQKAIIEKQKATIAELRVARGVKTANGNTAQAVDAPEVKVNLEGESVAA